jgi:hypothetical protein
MEGVVANVQDELSVSKDELEVLDICWARCSMTMLFSLPAISREYYVVVKGEPLETSEI